MYIFWCKSSFICHDKLYPTLKQYTTQTPSYTIVQKSKHDDFHSLLIKSALLLSYGQHVLFGSQVYKDNELFYYMDGYDTSKSNWMRYVNPAYSSAAQNLIACQYKVCTMNINVDDFIITTNKMQLFLIIYF